jgi:hypothetical protein
MVSAVRRGDSRREVARRFHVALHTVQRSVARAGAARLDRVDWSDRRAGVRNSARRTPLAVEDAILEARRALRTTSALGEYGAAAIRRTLQEDGGGMAVPAKRTIARILVRRGAVERPVRERRPPRPPGWHLPLVASGAVELDAFDVIEDLKVEHGPRLDVLTGMSLCGGLPAAWPLASATTSAILPCL